MTKNIEKSKEELDAIFEENQEFEKKIEKELIRKIEIRVRSAEIQKQLAKYEEIAEQNAKLEAELKDKTQKADEKRELVNSLKEKNSVVEKEACTTKSKIDSAKCSIVRMKNARDVAVQALEKKRAQIAEIRNSSAKEKRELEDDIEMAEIEIKYIDSRLETQGKKIERRMLERNALQEKLNSLRNKVDSIHKLKSENDSGISRDPIDPNEIAELEKRKEALQKQIQAVENDCASTEKKVLQSQIEERDAALQQAAAAELAQDQESALLDSDLESTKAELAATQQRIQELAERFEEVTEKANSLKSSSELDKRTKRLKKELRDTEQKIEATGKMIEGLTLAGEEAAIILRDLEAGNSKDIIAHTRKLCAEKKEEMRNNSEKLEQFQMMIEENKQKLAEIEKRFEDKKSSLTKEEEEIIVMKEQNEKMKAEYLKDQPELDSKLQELLQKVEAAKKLEAVKYREAEEKEKSLKAEVSKLQKQMKELNMSMKIDGSSGTDTVANDGAVAHSSKPAAVAIPATPDVPCLADTSSTANAPATSEDVSRGAAAVFATKECWIVLNRTEARKDLTTPKRSRSSEPDKFSRLSLSASKSSTAKLPQRSMSVDSQSSSRPLDLQPSSSSAKPMEIVTIEEEPPQQAESPRATPQIRAPEVTPSKAPLETPSKKSIAQEYVSIAKEFAVTPLGKDLESLRMTPAADRFPDSGEPEPPKDDDGRPMVEGKTRAGPRSRTRNFVKDPAKSSEAKSSEEPRPDFVADSLPETNSAVSSTTLNRATSSVRLSARLKSFFPQKRKFESSQTEQPAEKVRFMESSSEEVARSSQPKRRMSIAEKSPPQVSAQKIYSSGSISASTDKAASTQPKRRMSTSKDSHRKSPSTLTTTDELASSGQMSSPSFQKKPSSADQAASSEVKSSLPSQKRPPSAAGDNPASSKPDKSTSSKRPSSPASEMKKSKSPEPK